MHTQNLGVIKNPSANMGQPKGPQLNDRDMLNDVLATAKYVTDGYNVMVRETSHNQLFDTTMGILNETHQAAREAYNLMFKKGWYKLNSAQRQSLEQTQQQFTSYQNQFPQGGQMLQ